MMLLCFCPSKSSSLLFDDELKLWELRLPAFHVPCPGRPLHGAGLDSQYPAISWLCWLCEVSTVLLVPWEI